MMKTKSVVSQATTIKIWKKKILYLKKTIKMAEEEKNPKTNFRRLNFFDVC